MKLSQLLAGAVLSVSLVLGGCSATSALSTVTSAISPDKPELTAQVGAENTKQGIGATLHTSADTSIKDVSGGPVDASKKTSSITSGDVKAKQIIVSQSDTRSLLMSFGMGLATVLGLIMWFVPSPWKRKVKDDGSTKGAST